MSKYSISKKELMQLFTTIKEQAIEENLIEKDMTSLYGKLDTILHCGITNEELYDCIDTLYNVLYSKINPDYEPVIDLRKIKPVSYQVYRSEECIIRENCDLAIKIFESEQDTYKLMKLSPFTEDEDENE